MTTVATTAPPAAMAEDLPCHVCGYDLRAQPPDGICPECAAPVAEARRAAAIPRRPAWRDSDPRWRRRILAGAWLLALLPLVDLLKATGWAAAVPVPAADVFGPRGVIRTLDHTLLGSGGVHPWVVFCLGAVLLFSEERGRRRAPLDWTRRWGVLCCYVVLLLGATNFLFAVAQVLTGIAASFLGMPLKFQPAVTPLFMRLGNTYIRYGPNPMNGAAAVLLAAASVTVLLACVPLFDALRSSGAKRLAAALLAPLALFALVNLARVAWYCLGLSVANVAYDPYGGLFFRPGLVVDLLVPRSTFPVAWAPGPVALGVEAVKWCSVFVIAVWLTAARGP